MVKMLSVLISFSFVTMRAYAESLVRKHKSAGQLNSDSGKEKESIEIGVDGSIAISDFESVSTRKLSPSLARSAKQQGTAEVDANGKVVIADKGVSANKRSSSLVRGVKHKHNMNFANIMKAGGVKHVVTKVKDGVDLVEMMYTSPQRATNFTLQEAEALANSMNNSQPPSHAELKAQEAVVLADKPDPCVDEAITPGCNFAEGIATPESLAEVLALPLSSVNAFFDGGASLTCQELCQKAFAAIPVDARPPKSWVAARRVAGKLYWDIDGSPAHLRSMAEAAAEGGEVDPDSKENGEASHPEGEGHPTRGGSDTSDGSNDTSLPMMVVADEICTLFGIYPFVNPFTGSLLDVGGESGGVRSDTSYQCQSYRTYKVPCTCYTKNSYSSHSQISTIWAFVNLWNHIVRANLHSFNAIVWAPYIFKRSALDPVLTNKMIGLVNKIGTGVEVCWDIFYSFINGKVLAYTFRNDKFYYTLSGHNMDLVGKIITWFHEVAHMSPLWTTDVAPYGWHGVLGHSAANALRNADSYEIYVNRIMGSPVHYTNR